MYALYTHIYITWYVQYSHANRVIKLSLTSGQHFTCVRGAAVVPTGAGTAFAPILLPRGRSTLGGGVVPGRQWGAGQGCRAWGVGGCDEVQGEALSTPLLPPLARINIHGWAELGWVAKKGKAGGMGCGRKGFLGSFLKADSSRQRCPQ